MERAIVIGAGPNGLAAAIVLAQAGLPVDVYEAESEPGGAARTLPLTLPGFLHDFGSAVHPMAAGSPFFNTLPLGEYGLEWIHGEAPLAHPLDDGTAVVLERNLDHMVRTLGAVDARAWRVLMEPLVEHWSDLFRDAFRPLLRWPQHPLRMAKFGLSGLQPARWLARAEFGSERTRALFAGLAGHSLVDFNQPMGSAVGLMLAAAAHAVGWPVPRNGAGSITQALVQHLEKLGGKLHRSQWIDAAAFRALDSDGTLILCDISPRALVSIAGERLTSSFRHAAERFERGPGAFKVDYALSQPVPWRAMECRRAITVHLGGSFEEIAAAEHDVTRGHYADRPFVLAAQPSLFDSSRAPEGKHVLWAYCHVPNGSTVDMTERIEAQIERFAPGFRDCVLARKSWSPAALQQMDANLEGGDINGGAFTLRQFLFRPTLRAYATGSRNLYLCSASTPPGGGVHGMCGYHAAKTALRAIGKKT